jgi:hypothetical protein
MTAPGTNAALLDAAAVTAACAGRWRACDALAGVASPFEPLLALWQLGYVPEAITADGVVLVAPEVTDDR